MVKPPIGQRVRCCIECQVTSSTGTLNGARPRPGGLELGSSVSCWRGDRRRLPALDAAHIKPYSEAGVHLVSNGVLLRRDLHALFDKGYVTITPAMHVEVSRRIREEFENGRDYYRHHGGTIRVPQALSQRPAVEFLEWHNTHVYKG